MAGDAFVYGTSKACIFYFTYRFAGVERHAFAFTCPLYAAFAGSVDERCFFIFPYNVGFIKVGIKAELQGEGKAFQTGIFG